MRTNRPLADDLGFLLSRASGVVARTVSEALAPLGLRVRSYSILTFAAEDTTGVTQRRLAVLMGLDPSQIVAFVDELEGRGLVRRAPDPSDRRNKLVVATETGRRVREDAQHRVETAYDDCFDRVSSSHLDELRRTLREIAFPDESPTEQSAMRVDEA